MPSGECSGSPAGRDGMDGPAESGCCQLCTDPSCNCCLWPLACPAAFKLKGSNFTEIFSSFLCVFLLTIVRRGCTLFKTFYPHCLEVRGNIIFLSLSRLSFVFGSLSEQQPGIDIILKGFTALTVLNDNSKTDPSYQIHSALILKCRSTIRSTSY